MNSTCRSATVLARAFALSACVLLTIAGCDTGDATESVASSKSTRDTVSVQTDSVNYMHERSANYTLYDLGQTPPRAIGGAIVDRLASGGAKGCCVGLPRTWHPGMKVRVVWRESDRTTIYEYRTQDMEIPRYDEPADLYVVFYPPHEVELVVSGAEPGHPEWRGRIKKTPWEQCVETYTRKPCFMALPKQFDTRSSQGFCTYLAEEKEDDSDVLCRSALIDCVRDFEDDVFCKGLLWGPRRKQ